MQTEQATTHPTRLYGILAAMVTPMTADEDVDYGRLEAFTDYLILQGVHGLIPLGSTGEYYALNADERERVLNTVVSCAAGRVPVIAGANGGSTREVIHYCRQAEELGADGVMLAPPYYSLPTLDELDAHFAAIDNAIGIPIMLYNYPGRTGVDMPPAFIERLARLPNVAYVKESTGEMPRITELLRRCGGRLGVFCGCDTIALESLFMGAMGWVGGAVNALAKAHVDLYDLVVVHRDYDRARRLFSRMLPALETFEGGGKYTQFVKAACGLAGQQVGPPRAPLQAATNADRSILQQALESAR